MVNALTTAKELKQEGDKVVVVFDGAGTKWIPALSDPDHRYHELLESVRDRDLRRLRLLREGLWGLRGRRAERSRATRRVRRAPQPRGYLADGYAVITF